MNKISKSILALIIFAGCSVNTPEYWGLSEDIIISKKDTILSDKIVYHEVRVDENGNILPWYSANPGESSTNVKLGNLYG